jgi:tRNA threonylcarbamoyladenosine biosynthesis protein TsaB
VLTLALETSGLGGSVALVDRDSVLSERQLAEGRRSGEWLAPAIDEVLREARREPKQLQLVAVTTGPGSFTGLRVGVTTAKTLAYAAGCDVIGINTLDVIAGLVPPPLGGNGAELQVVMDAQRKELFVARYHLHESGPRRIAADAIVPTQAWLDSLALGTVVSGTGLAKIEARLPPGVIAADPQCREPRATTVALLARGEYEFGRRDDLWKLAPVYLRLSYAEEKAGPPKSA